jgi:hypothetical protein
MIEFKPGRYFAVIAFVYGGPTNRDWLATLYRDRDPDGPWVMAYRFRYYADADPFSKKDHKNIYEAKLNTGNPAREEEFTGHVRVMAEMLIAKGYAEKLDWMLLKSDDPHHCADLLATRPWAHKREATPEERERFLKRAK